MSQAIGNGVICESWLYVNQPGLVGPVSVIVTLVGLLATTDFTSSGMPPGEYAAQPSFWTLRMFIQNTTCWAVTLSPFDHLYGFRSMVTPVLFLVYFGRAASEIAGFSDGVLPLPNQ